MVDNQNDPVLMAQRTQCTQLSLEPSAIEWMFVCFVQDLHFFSEAREIIALRHFQPHELALRVVYEGLCNSLDLYRGITYQTLCTEVENIFKQDQTVVLTDEETEIIFRADADGLLYRICNPVGVEFDKTNINLARNILRRFAHERTIVAPLRTVMSPGFSNTVPADLNSFLDVINKQQSKLNTINMVPEVQVAPEVGAVLDQPNIFKHTGVGFIDEVLGGQRVGDCNGLIGPTGGGKTTLAIQMAVAAAKQSWNEAQLNNTEPELSVFVTIEEAANKLRPRAWSVACDIPVEKLMDMQDWSILTQPGQLDPYERRMQEGQPVMLSEIERYQLYAPQLRECLVMLDLSGSDQFPDAGNGGVDEIVSYLARYNRPIRSVFVDYAGLLCSRYMQAKGMDASTSGRHILKEVGDNFRKKVSERFQCTTWLLHQLKGDSSNASAFKLMTHGDAGESKDFAVNMSVCGCLGKVDPATGCRRLNWSKVRYRPNEEVTPITLKINRQFARMDDVSHQYIADEVSRQFITNEDNRTIHGVNNNAQPNTATTRLSPLHSNDLAEL